MKHFPRENPPRFAGLEHYVSRLDAPRASMWRLFWRALAMGSIAFVVCGGLTLAALMYLWR